MQKSKTTFLIENKSLDTLTDDEILSDQNTKSISTSQQNVIQKIEIQVKTTTESQILEIGELNRRSNEIFLFDIKAEVHPNNRQFTWKVYKTYIQIKDSFNQIQTELKNKNSLTSEIESQCKHYAKISNDLLKSQLDELSKAYKDLFTLSHSKDLISLKEFFCISNSSFIESNSGNKPMEAIGYKEAEPRNWRSIIKIFCYYLEYLIYRDWNKRWIVLRKDMICYLDKSTAKVGKNVYWFDEEIKVTRPYDNNILQIENMSGKLTLKFSSKLESELWMKEINKRVSKIHDTLENNPYCSYTDPKEHCNAKWFIDGKDYFSTLLDKLLKAEETVFITDWWLSPEMFLNRPIDIGEYSNLTEEHRKEILNDKRRLSRFMDVINYLAKKGVKIYILVYSEVSLALPLNSKHTKTTLNNLHQNIRVTRHPKNRLNILWSHHEKLVIIDQKVAFVGGLDICWGRYDTNMHPIVEPENIEGKYEFPGIDYSNARILDFKEVDNYMKESVSRKEQCRMPWHDVHSMLEGPVVQDVARHFVERWNHARFDNRNLGIVDVKQAEKLKTNETLKKKKGLEMTKTITPSMLKRKKREIDISSKDKLFPIMREENNDNEINTMAKNNLISQDNSDDNEENINVYDSIPKEAINSVFTSDRVNTNSKKIVNFVGKVSHSYFKFKKKKSERLSNQFELNDPKSSNRSFICQVLRSVSNWSIGKKKTEHSILKGYYKLIDGSNHYIYIENQFFISKTYSEEESKSQIQSNEKLIINEIGFHIRDRIEKAYYEGQKFRVFILIPLLPGFEGEIENSFTVNFILKQTYKTISRNYNLSLFETLYQKMGDKINDYLIFLSLRNHGVLNGVPLTELIYIHSKLMIIDDEKVLIGSANINDRSMLGYRDSEFAVIIEKGPSIDSVMDDKECKVSEFASSFRRALMAEHLGIDKDDNLLIDPLSNELFKLIKNRAKDNTVLYREIFNCYPDDTFSDFASLRNRKIPQSKENLPELLMNYNEKKDKIKGHIVEFPLRFLKDEERNIGKFAKENLVPDKNFT